MQIRDSDWEAIDEPRAHRLSGFQKGLGFVPDPAEEDPTPVEGLDFEAEEEEPDPPVNVELDKTLNKTLKK